MVVIEEARDEGPREDGREQRQLTAVRPIDEQAADGNEVSGRRHCDRAGSKKYGGSDRIAQHYDEERERSQEREPQGHEAVPAELAKVPEALVLRRVVDPDRRTQEAAKRSLAVGSRQVPVQCLQPAAAANDKQEEQGALGGQDRGTGDESPAGSRIRRQYECREDQGQDDGRKQEH